MEKKRRGVFGRHGESGMTLIEIMIVLVILGMMAGLGIRTVYKQYAKAKIKTTQLAMQEVGNAVNSYRSDNNKPPADLKVLELDEIETIPNDGWGREFHYEVPGPNNRPYDIVSDGPDESPGTDDDIRLSDLKK